jgi:alpha-L-fucosidase
MNAKFTETWLLRCRDLVDQHRPDLLYFHNIGNLPLGQAGLDIAAHFYNASLQWHGGKLEVVLNVKEVDEARRPALVEDYERGSSEVIQPFPWQTDTCIGDWHYNHSIYDQHRYKTVGEVVRTLANIVSKNGNLLPSIPVRGDGSIDEDEVSFLEGMAKWIGVNGEAIFGTRPWKVFGEGPTKAASGMFSEGKITFSAQDIRFTAKGDVLYAFLLGWPGEKGAAIRSLASTSSLLAGQKITDVSLLGYSGKLEWSQYDLASR